MQDTCTLPFACAATHSAISEWSRYLLAVMNHSDLNQDQKNLWMWLTVHSARHSHHTCSVSYEQLSAATKLPIKTIHSALFKLRLMGFLNGDIPVWYGIPTPEMNKKVRVIRPILISEETIYRQRIIKRLKEEQLLHTLQI